GARGPPRAWRSGPASLKFFRTPGHPTTMRKWLLALLLLAARPAWADGGERPWYGWQLLLADARAVALRAVPVSPQSRPLARGMGMTAFFMNGPIVHMAHRNPRSASLSLLRLPLLWLGRVAGGTAGQLL